MQNTWVNIFLFLVSESYDFFYSTIAELLRLFVLCLKSLVWASLNIKLHAVCRFLTCWFFMFCRYSMLIIIDTRFLLRHRSRLDSAQMTLIMTWNLVMVHLASLSQESLPVPFCKWHSLFAYVFFCFHPRRVFYFIFIPV